MFEVRDRYGEDNRKVYDVKEVNDVLYFLLYAYREWRWVEAKYYEPIEESEGVGY